MFDRLLRLIVVCAALAACGPPDPSPKAGEVAAQAPADAEKKTVSAVPEHFDRVRAEQYESEEDRLTHREPRN
jgi:hypothetical protein